MKNTHAISLRAFVAAALFTALAGVSAPILADWTINDGAEGEPTVEPQDIVITLKQNPRLNPEASCLAITLARSLRGDFSVPTGANVTLFPTLDGVAIGNARIVARPRFRCSTPEGQISLQENLEDFLCDTGDRDNCPANLNMDNLVQCPLCWAERFGEWVPPDYGVLDPAAVGAVLLNAEKVIDF